MGVGNRFFSNYFLVVKCEKVEQCKVVKWVTVPGTEKRSHEEHPNEDSGENP